jgi:GAF domain-containing protein
LRPCPCPARAGGDRGRRAGACLCVEPGGGRAAGYRAVHSTPLLTSSGKLLEIVSVHFREPHGSSEREFHLAEMYAGQAADVIAAQLLQGSLRASEGRLRKVLETDAVGVIFLEKEGTFIDANKPFLRMTASRAVRLRPGSSPGAN